jgi:hypothetical protein
VKDLFLTLVGLIVVTTFLLWQSPGRSLQWIAFSASRSEMPKPAVLTAPPSKTASKSAHVVKAGRTAAEACSCSFSQRPQQSEPDQYSVTVTPDQYSLLVTPDEYFPSLRSARLAVGVVRMVPPPEKIALGVDSDMVTDQYGEPSAWATSAEGGHMVETFVYAQQRGGPATVIRIVDGRVVAAYTKVVPFSPRGSLDRNVGLPN